MITDRELLRRYFDEGSETAFAEITRRHIDLVYGTALRQLCGNATLAEDVTQSVFATLAGKRGTGLHIKHLPGWLYRTTRFTVSRVVRSERRRQSREQQAFAMQDVYSPADASDSPDLPPGLLDELLESMDDLDREAILLRFFEGQPFTSIGLALDTSEDAARMRVNRALEKLRVRFAKAGITSSAAGLGVTLAGHAVAAPAGLAAQVSAATLANAAALAATTAPQLGLFTLMSTSKSIAWVAGATAVLAGGYSFHQYREAEAHRLTIRQLTEERTSLRAKLHENDRRAAILTERVELADRRLAEMERESAAHRAASSPNPSLARPVPAPLDPATLRRERLGRLKPLLEAGLPIKGAVVLHVEGVAASRPVELVVGKTSHVEGDDGTYSVTPALNEDGSIKYSIQLVRTDPQSGREQIVGVPVITQIPWEGFSMSIAGLSVMAFDPDPAALGVD